MGSFFHRPVLVAEVLKALKPRAGGAYADGTVGAGGHAKAILEASGPDGRVYGTDRDPAALRAAGEHLVSYGVRVELRPGCFRELADWLAPASCDGILLDLGVSSPQLDDAERGFSFQQDGPLDMRMDTRQSMTAAQLVNESSEEELVQLLREFGEEPQARRLARAMAKERGVAPFQRTGQLAGLIARIIPRRGSKVHPATRVFQALRIAVNDELTNLRVGLRAIWPLLKPGGRLAVVTFHSLEDRLVKEFGRERTRTYTFPGEVDVPELRQPVPAQAVWVERKAIHPSPKEVGENPRSRSAQLRVLERI